MFPAIIDHGWNTVGMDLVFDEVLVGAHGFLDHLVVDCEMDGGDFFVAKLGLDEPGFDCGDGSFFGVFVVEKSLIDDAIFALAGEDFVDDDVTLARSDFFSSKHVTHDNIGILKFVGAVWILNGIRHDFDVVFVEETSVFLIEVRTQTN